MTTRAMRSTFLFTVLFLFFLQLTSDFVAAVYAFGLLGTGIPLEILSVLLFFSPLLLLFLRRGVAARWIVLLGELALVCRLLEPLLDTRLRMLVSGVGVGVFLLFFPALLVYLRRDPPESASLQMGGGLAFALALAVLLRALGSGLDLSTIAAFQVIGWLLALPAAVFLVQLVRPQGRAVPSAPRLPAAALKIAGLSLGMTCAWALLYFAFASPNVIARWSGESFILVLLLLTAALFSFGSLFLSGRRGLLSLKPAVIWLWNALFVASLALAIWSQQTPFPASAGAYPLLAARPPAWSLAALALSLLLSPVILLDFIYFSRELVTARPTLPQVGAGFLLGALFLVFLILAHVFTTTYDYIPAVGPLFRDQFWLVYLVAGLGLALPVLLVRDFTLKVPAELPASSRLAPLVMWLLAGGALGGALWNAPRPASPSPAPASLRLLTYNIQQGYSASGQKSFAAQLAVLRAAAPDLIGLQESDTNRISGGNDDLVRYFADRLGMYSYYGPKSVDGTFGIALLSRYPIQDARTYYLYSQGEQTALITARVQVGGETYNVFVTHLGNGGPLIQQQNVLSLAQGMSRLVLVGDFNFRPPSQQYQLTTTILRDAWLSKEAPPIVPPEVDPQKRIDHIFVSPDLRVLDARYLTGPQSDHPAMLAVLEP